MQQHERQTISVQEAAARLGIGRDLAYELANTRRIPALRLGHRIVIPTVAFERWLENGGEFDADDMQ